MSKVSIIGIDLAKLVFQLVGITASGKECFNKRLNRGQVLKFLAKQPKCLVAVEACCGAHYWAKAIQGLGHDVKILPPQQVKPYVQVHKNDIRDAQAIAEAASRPRLTSVAIKSDEQLDLQAIHRVRDRLLKERTAIGNEVRGILMERGIVLPQGHKPLREGLQLLLEDAENDLSIRCRHLVKDLQSQWLERHARIQDYDAELERLAKQSESCRRLQSIPGVGPVISTLLHSFMGDGKAFKTSRHLSAALGLVPRQHASGGKEGLLGISKQGNKHLRKQLVHGARAAYRHLKEGKPNSRLARWVQSMQGKHPNKIVVALANKLARIAWSIQHHQSVYQP